MKIKLNTIFFSITFIATLIAESYCILVLEADIYTVVGLGIVVLINLYLLLESIRSLWMKSRDKAIYYLEQLYKEETEKQQNRYTELLNLQKATYTAIKKQTAGIEESLEELAQRIDSVEKSNITAFYKITELQKKQMEGQKNALNIEVNYNKENTKQLIAALKEEIGNLKQESMVKKQWQGDTLPYEEQNYEASEENDESIYEYNEESDEYTDETDKMQDIKPLYDDPNKALTADEIAALFNTYGT